MPLKKVVNILETNSTLRELFDKQKCFSLLESFRYAIGHLKEDKDKIMESFVKKPKYGDVFTKKLGTVVRNGMYFNIRTVFWRDPLATESSIRQLEANLENDEEAIDFVLTSHFLIKTFGLVTKIENSTLDLSKLLKLAMDSFEYNEMLFIDKKFVIDLGYVKNGEVLPIVLVPTIEGETDDTFVAKLNFNIFKEFYNAFGIDKLEEVRDMILVIEFSNFSDFSYENLYGECIVLKAYFVKKVEFQKYEIVSMRNLLVFPEHETMKVIPVTLEVSKVDVGKSVVIAKSEVGDILVCKDVGRIPTTRRAKDFKSSNNFAQVTTFMSNKEMGYTTVMRFFNIGDFKKGKAVRSLEVCQFDINPTIFSENFLKELIQKQNLRFDEKGVARQILKSSGG